MEDIVRLPQMSFSESVKTVLNKLTDFKGRARRSELWWFWILYAVVSVVLNLSLAGMQVVSSVVSMLLLLSSAPLRCAACTTADTEAGGLQQAS